MDVARLIERQKIIVIVRRIYGDGLKLLAESLAEGGIKLMEVTFDQSDVDCLKKTSQAIESIRQSVGSALCLGAGTVLTQTQLDVARQAGAKFIISPNTNAEIIKKTKSYGMMSIPGAMTPTEMQNAYEFGADFVKVFPYNRLGAGYMKDIMAPLSQIPFIATGGVTHDNLSEILSIGFQGVGVGSSLANKQYIKDKRSDLIIDSAKRMVEIVNKTKSVSQ